MSVEITLFTKTASKTGLIKFLVSNNFQKTKHFLDAMNNSNTIHFMWFGFDNYESSVGVEATVYKSSSEEKNKYHCTDWILHTRTRSSGTYEDKQKQNDIIKLARKEFGGSFYNDWYGANKYIKLSDYTKYAPLDKGIAAIAERSLEKLDQINNCLNGYTNKTSEDLSNIKPEIMRSLLIDKDPSILLYNSLMPFLVSVLEYFFGQCFANFIKYDPNAKNLLVEEKIKLGISEVLSILQKENSLEQIITQTYNFQNLESINKAFKKYLSIDVFATLSKKKKVNGKIFRILTTVQEILDARHRFVHELDINYDLTKEMYLNYVEAIKSAINLTLEAFQKKGLIVKIDD